MIHRRLVLFAALLLLALHAPALPLTNLWSLRTGVGVTSCPALSPNGILYFGSSEGYLYAVSTNRYIEWIFETGLQIKSSPAIADDGNLRQRNSQQPREFRQCDTLVGERMCDVEVVTLGVARKSRSHCARCSKSLLAPTILAAASSRCPKSSTTIGRNPTVRCSSPT